MGGKEALLNNRSLYGLKHGNYSTHGTKKLGLELGLAVGYRYCLLGANGTVGGGTPFWARFISVVRCHSRE